MMTAYFISAPYSDKSRVKQFLTERQTHATVSAAMQRQHRQHIPIITTKIISIYISFAALALVFQGAARRSGLTDRA